jgi:putative ABC transport system permease protein
MFKSHLKSALRNLLKHKGYSFINVIGLALGMACCLMILLWVIDELSYDRFHEKVERTYRVALQARINIGFDFGLLSAPHGADLAPIFRKLNTVPRFIRRERHHPAAGKFSTRKLTPILNFCGVHFSLDQRQ